MFDRTPLASIVLGANSSAISAIANDYGYEQVFARELEGVAKSGDVFIPITTSGKSRNIVVAVELAKRQGLVTVAFTGEGGGKLPPLCDCLCVPSRETARIQECHIMIGHIVCGLVEKAYFARTEP
jgi:D-sedoheptulose 7-phosphate isomerase